MRKMPQRVLAEFLGTAFLLAAVIGSGIMAERLAGGNLALALLANTFATVGALYVLIEIFGPISGAHFNPLVSLALWRRKELALGALLAYLVAQALGALLGAALAHAMFDLPILAISAKSRYGAGQWIAEGVAAAGLIIAIFLAPARRVAAIVASYIGAAYWFTSSTSFANPAAVLGRMFTDTFAGIAPASAPGFILGELAGAAAGLLLLSVLRRD